MSQNLTRRERLQVLPLQKRLQAMEAIRREGFFEQDLNHTCHPSSTIAGAITFEYTRQGHSYWWNINTKYFSNGK